MSVGLHPGPNLYRKVGSDLTIPANVNGLHPGPTLYRKVGSNLMMPVSDVSGLHPGPTPYRKVGSDLTMPVNLWCRIMPCLHTFEAELVLLCHVLADDSRLY